MDPRTSINPELHPAPDDHPAEGTMSRGTLSNVQRAHAFQWLQADVTITSGSRNVEP